MAEDVGGVDRPSPGAACSPRRAPPVGVPPVEPPPVTKAAGSAASSDMERRRPGCTATDWGKGNGEDGHGWPWNHRDRLDNAFVSVSCSAALPPTIFTKTPYVRLTYTRHNVSRHGGNFS